MPIFLKFSFKYFFNTLYTKGPLCVHYILRLLVHCTSGRTTMQSSKTSMMFSTSIRSFLYISSGS